MDAVTDMMQIQPHYKNGEEWMAFACREDLYFESAELFAPHAYGNAEMYRACAEWYRASGRTRSIHGAFVDVNPASGDPEIREISRRRCRESCRTAEEIGAEFVVLHGSCLPFLRGAYIDDWADSCAAFYTELALAYPKLVLCIENSMDIDTNPLSELMARIKVPNVRVCLDFGHAQYSGTPLAKWFADLGDNIGYIHLSDNYGKFDDHLALGRGVIDWKEADSLYRSLGRNLPVTLEVVKLEDTAASLEFLRRNQLFGM